MTEQNHYLPINGRVIDIFTESSDIKTYTVSLEQKVQYIPGQFFELSIFGLGECPISISSTPTRGSDLLFSIKEVGEVTAGIHQLKTGEAIGVRGPFGNGFQMDDFKGKDLVIVCGGIGLAPLRSVLNYVLDNANDFGKITLIYGSSSELIFKQELDEWSSNKKIDAHINWDMKSGFVRSVLPQVADSNKNALVITCGPAIQVKYVLESLHDKGFKPEQLYTTLEMKMKCGIGKCGRCNIGHQYVCVDGPVFSYEQLLKMPKEF